MTNKVDWLVVGLGNPGKKYSNNRHNIGWMVAAELCNKHKKPMLSSSDLYIQSSMRLAGQLVVTILPTTYMNSSGEAVIELAEEYDIPPERVIVIVDEYNFPTGKVHFKASGGDGGHNGIASIIEYLESGDFLRIRCGVGNDFGPNGLVDYVLADFPEEEEKLKLDMVNRAVEAIETIICLNNSGKAMSLINSGKLWEKETIEKSTEPE